MESKLEMYWTLKYHMHNYNLHRALDVQLTLALDASIVNEHAFSQNTVVQ